MMPSVTTVLGILDKPGMVQAAANITAAADPGIPERERSREYLRRWAHAANLGTLVHRAHEHMARGEGVSIPGILAEMEAEGTEWTRTLEQIVDDATPLLRSLTDAWATMLPVTVSVEDVVCYTDPLDDDGLHYYGTSDWRCHLGGRSGVQLVDLKTTQKRTGGIYLDTWTLQLAAYAYATDALVYPEGSGHRPYARGIEPLRSRALAEPDQCWVLHVRPGSWDMIEIDAGPRAQRIFLKLREIWGWRQACSATTR